MTRSMLAVRHVLFEDLGLLAPLLAKRGYAVEYIDAGVDEVTPERLADPDLLVVLGGPIGVYETDAYPMLAAEKRALAARVQAGAPTLGICLGAQLMADVLGAEVAATGRHEIGYGPLTVTEEGLGSVLAPLDGVPVLHWHGDQFAIPEGAERLAETPNFPNQAFSKGSHLLGLQFHLEADSHTLERWLIGHAYELAQRGVDLAQLRADSVQYGSILAGAAEDVMNAWLDGIE